MLEGEVEGPSVRGVRLRPKFRSGTACNCMHMNEAKEVRVRKCYCHESVVVPRTERVGRLEAIKVKRGDR